MKLISVGSGFHPVSSNLSTKDIDLSKMFAMKQITFGFVFHYKLIQFTWSVG